MNTVIDTIECKICGMGVHSIELHLKKVHGDVSLARYVELHPDAPLLSDKAQKIVDDNARRTAEAAPVPLTLHHAAVVPITAAAARPSHKANIQDLFELTEQVVNTRGVPNQITVMDPSPEVAQYVPDVDPGHVWDVETLKSMAMALELSYPMYLFGHKGTAKTTSFEQLAARTKRALLRVQHSIGTEESHVVGQWTIQDGQTKFELGPLALAMKHGWIYLADEYDFALPSVLAVYQAVLEGKSLVIKEADHANRIIRMHPNFRFWANGNTNGAGDETGLYPGTTVQNSANYDRFGMMIEMKYMSAEKESQIVVNRSGISKKEADKLVGFAGDIRKQFEARKISDTISTRGLVYVANIGLRRGSMSLGIQLCFSNKLTAVDRAVVNGVSQRLYG